jgi:hypothetical protein
MTVFSSILRARSRALNPSKVDPRPAVYQQPTRDDGVKQNETTNKKPPKKKNHGEKMPDARHPTQNAGKKKSDQSACSLRQEQKTLRLSSTFCVRRLSSVAGQATVAFSTRVYLMKPSGQDRIATLVPTLSTLICFKNSFRAL